MGSSSTSSISYASVLNKNLNDSIKLAIVENIEYQKQVNADRTIIVIKDSLKMDMITVIYTQHACIFDMLHSYDYSDLHMNLQCHTDIAPHMCIDCATNTSARQYIKVKFKLVSDCKYGLIHANFLNKNSYYPGV